MSPGYQVGGIWKGGGGRLVYIMILSLLRHEFRVESALAMPRKMTKFPKKKYGEFNTRISGYYHIY